jgi:prepilin-type N-terminal cleavage/methylation domain-containing protein
MSKPAFTLIELLVVVTIIVVLLALLTPALDRAIYRAELTVCATNIKAMGSTATMYAASHQRSYPDLAGRNWPYHLSSPFVLMLAPYTALNRTLNCPFSEALDYEGSVRRSSAGGIIPPYALWFGWKYTGP